MEQLASYLRKARTDKGLTLRAVQEQTGISNPYLSQLENHKIRKPSPAVLHKLADCYGLQYEHLMELSGYPAPEQTRHAKPSFRISSAFSELTKEEEEKLAEYLEFLRSRKSK